MNSPILKKISAKVANVDMRATVQKSGKLGFSIEAIEKMGITNDKGIILYIDESDPASTNLYLEVVGMPNEDAYKINKGGDYYNAQTRDFFSYLEIDYTRDTIRYDIRATEVDGRSLFHLKRKEPTKRQKTKNEARERNPV